MNTNQEVVSGLNADTGERGNHDLNLALETVHSLTSEGRGIILTLTELAERKAKADAERKGWSYSPNHLPDYEFKVRENLNKAWRYTGGRNGRRVGMALCLSTDDGIASPDREWIVGVELEGTTAGSILGRYGLLRIKPNAIDLRGRLHTLKLTSATRTSAKTGEMYTNYYLNGDDETAHNIEGFIKGYAYLMDLQEELTSVMNATTTIREAYQALNTVEREVEADDRIYRDTVVDDPGF